MTTSNTPARPEYTRVGTFGRIALCLTALTCLAATPAAFASGTATPALVIGGGAQMRLKPNTRLTLDCDLKNYGTFTAATSSRVVVNGYGSPLLRGVSQFGDLQMAMHGTAALANAATVNGQLVLTSGRLSLAGHDLTTAVIVGGSANSYVVTPDTLGQLVRQIGNLSPVNFPVGNATYNPLTARLLSGYAVVRVGVIDNGTSTGLVPSAYLTRSWNIGSTGGPTGPLDLTLQWNNGEQGPAYQRNMLSQTGERAWRWNGSVWQFQPGILTGDNEQYPAVVALSAATRGLWTLASNSYVSGVEIGALPARLQFAPVWPNPVRDDATVRFGLPARAHAKVSLYTVRGERIAVLYDDDGDAGWHSTKVDSRRIASGAYFLRLESGGQVVTSKVMVVR